MIGILVISSTDCLQTAVQFIENTTNGIHFSFIFPYFPHDPRTPPGEYATMYKPEEVPVPENFLPEHPFDNGEMRIRDEVLAPFPRTPEIVQQHIADYYGMISSQDAEMGRLLQTLEAKGHLDNTIVIYTADHGPVFGQQDARKRTYASIGTSIFAGPGSRRHNLKHSLTL